MCISYAWQIFCKGYDSCIGQCRWNEQEETEISLGPLNQLKRFKKNSLHPSGITVDIFFILESCGYEFLNLKK